MSQVLDAQQPGGILSQLLEVIFALAGLLVALAQAIVPWTPLLAWIAFWLLAVNWRKLYPVLAQGGWIGVGLLALMAVLIWSSVAEPQAGTHSFYGLQVNNFSGKVVYVTGLSVIAFLCGTVQLSGACGRLCNFQEEPAPAEEAAHH